jgi:putative endonuclease
MPSTVYILHSASANKFYIGETEDLLVRLENHLNKTFKGAYTVQASDWILVWQLKCANRLQARDIEGFIKKMKSKKFIQSLINSNGEWLLERFPTTN